MVALLKPGGRLILSVPNAAVMRNIDPGNQVLLDKPPHHMTQWNVDVFYALAKLLPISVKASRCEPLAPYHVSWFVHGFLHSRMRFAGPRVTSIFVSRYLTFPLRLVLTAGLRRFFPGHTLLVELELVPTG